MTKPVKKAYRMYRRKNGVYYLHNNQTNEQTSLKTSDKAEAERLLSAHNEARQPLALNMEVGMAYIRGADPKMATRTWQEAIDELCSHGKETSQLRCKREMESKAYDLIRNKPIVETTSEDFRAVLKRGRNTTNNYLRRLHNLALGNGWMRWHVVPPRQWEKPKKKEKRGITLEEHGKIIAAEQNEERRYYYEMLWLLGAAQTDCALLKASNVNWGERFISYQRKKTGEWSHLGIGTELEVLLKKLPSEGFLFPKIALMQDKHRSAEFSRRCRLLKLEGISLHSYRYAWAERAYTAGYEERFAQAALGHKSRAVHYAYARRARVICPPLENKIVPFKPQVASEPAEEKSA